MPRIINFVNDRRKVLSEVEEKDKKNLKIAGGLTAFLVFVLLATFGIDYYFNYETNKLTTEQNRVRSAIMSQAQIEQEYNVFAQKLQKLSVFFGRRKDKQEALVFFSEVFGQDVVVSGIDYSSADEDLVSFTIQSKNIFAMENAFKILESPDLLQKYQKISKSSLSRNTTGSYTLDLVIVLGQKEKKEN